jgi:hypothetical protein
MVLNLTGRKIGKLTVIKKAYSKNKRIYWECQCDCPDQNIIFVRGSSLVRKNPTKSCGCLQGLEEEENGNYKSGMTHSLLRHRYRHMINRCFTPGTRQYDDYGARGITVFHGWVSEIKGVGFAAYKKYIEENFPDYEDLLNKGYQINRINNDGNYEPGNLSIVTPEENSNNRRNNKFIEYAGETLTISKMARKYNMSIGLLGGRLRKGWDIEKALFKPSQNVPKQE